MPGGRNALVHGARSGQASRGHPGIPVPRVAERRAAERRSDETALSQWFCKGIGGAIVLSVVLIHYVAACRSNKPLERSDRAIDVFHEEFKRR